MSILDYRKPDETPAECLDRYRRCMPTCSDCGAEIVNDIDAVFGICGDCMDTARGWAVLGTPSSTASIATASVNGRARIEARERDDFEDMDEPTCEGDVDDGWSRQAIQSYLVANQDES